MCGIYTESILMKTIHSLTLKMYRKIFTKLYKGKMEAIYSSPSLRSHRGVLSSRNGLGVLRRVHSLSTFRNSLRLGGWGMIIEISDLRGIRHLFSPQAGQTSDCLAGAGDVLDINLIEVHLLGRVPPPGSECLESQMDPVCLGRVSD
jgi:hypothetical protein